MIITYDIQRLIGLNIVIITTSLSVIFFSNIGLVYAVEFKNYTSEQFKIQFQYPSDWSVDEKTTRFDEGTDLKISSSKLGEVLLIGYIEDNSASDVQSATYELLKQAIDDYKNEYQIIEKPTFLEIDNHNAGTFVYSSKDKYEDFATLWGHQQWVVSVGDHGYLISYMNLANSFDNPSSIEIREKFINSIEFLGNLSNTAKSNTISRFG